MSPLTVNLDGRKNAPATFSRRGRTYHVTDVQDCWRLIGNWWDGHGEKTFFRVRVSDGGVFELAYDHGNHNWQLHRVED
jgi:hypothetical protein